MRVGWFASRLRREPVAAWPARLWAQRPLRLPPRPPLAPLAWPGGLAVPTCPPPDPQVPGDLRSRWGRDRAQRAAFDALRGEDPGPLPPAPPAQAHEAAFRLVSLALIAAARPEADLAGAAHDLADRIAARPSRGTSARNHAVGERAALALAAVLLPGSPRVERFRALAAELPALLEQEIDPDGFPAEAALGYHLQNLDWGLLGWWCGVPGLEGALLRGAAAAADLLDDDGALPDVGDDDGGAVLPSTLGDRERAGAVLQALRAPVPPGYAPGLAAGLLSLPDVVGTRPPAARSGRQATLLRRGPHRLLLDHGPHGAPPLYGHAHADALAVWWAPDGRWAVGGRGTHQYLADPLDRNRRRGAAGAATLLVDGRCPSIPHAAPFLWRAVAHAARIAADLERATATGEVRAAHGVHRRTVTLGEDGSVALVDALDGRGAHHVSLRFPLRPGARVRIEADPALVARAIGEEHSPRYGALVPATTLLCEGVVRLPCALRTTLRCGTV